MGTLGFDKYCDPLKVYLSKYREAVKGEKPEKKTIVKKIEPSNSNSYNSSQYQYQYQYQYNNTTTSQNAHELPRLNGTTTTVIVSNDTKVYSYESDGQTIYYTTTNDGTNVQVYPQPDGTYIQYVSYQTGDEADNYDADNIVGGGTKRTQEEADIGKDDENDTKASKL